MTMKNPPHPRPIRAPRLTAQFGGTIRKSLCKCKKPVTRFGNPCDIYLEAQERSQRKQRKEERKKYECYRDQKGNRGNVGNCRALSRAMRSYEKALKSGIQLQEESVNLWKELLTEARLPRGTPGGSSSR